MTEFDPLTFDQLEWLNELLLGRIPETANTVGMDEGILDVSELDGFLTAIVSGPVTLLPSQWLPAMWGNFEPVWESADAYQKFVSLVIQHSNSIVSTLMDEPESYEPMFLEHSLKGQTFTIVDEWCEGYVRAVRLNANDWLDGGPEIQELLAPIRSFTEETSWEAHELTDSAEQDLLRDSIAPNVREIHARWLANRSETHTPVRRAHPRVGRNDPCPCGSGKKFKRCCLH